MTTFIPALEQARAIPNPIPSEAAVMYAVLPATSFNGGGCGAVGAGGATNCARALRPTPTPDSKANAPALKAIPSRKRRRSSATGRLSARFGVERFFAIEVPL